MWAHVYGMCMVHVCTCMCRCVTCMSGRCHMHVTCMYVRCHMHITCMYADITCIPHAYMSDVTCMSHACMSDVTCMYVSCHMHVCQMSHACHMHVYQMSHACRMYVRCHMYRHACHITQSHRIEYLPIAAPPPPFWPTAPTLCSSATEAPRESTLCPLS